MRLSRRASVLELAILFETTASVRIGGVVEEAVTY